MIPNFLRPYQLNQHGNSVSYNCDTIQVMPGLEGDLEVWQTQEVNVIRGKAEGDIDLEGLPFLKVILEPRHYLYIVFPPVEIMHSDWIIG